MIDTGSSDGVVLCESATVMMYGEWRSRWVGVATDWDGVDSCLSEFLPTVMSSVSRELLQVTDPIIYEFLSTTTNSTQKA